MDSRFLKCTRPQQICRQYEREIIIVSSMTLIRKNRPKYKREEEARRDAKCVINFTCVRLPKPGTFFTFVKFCVLIIRKPIQSFAFAGYSHRRLSSSEGPRAIYPGPRRKSRAFGNPPRKFLRIRVRNGIEHFSRR